MELSIIEKMQDPELIATLSLGEKLRGSLIVMALGLGTCLVVLAIIMLAVKIMHALLAEKPKKEKPMPASGEILGDEAAAIIGAVTEMEGGKPFNVVDIRQVR